MAKSKYKTTFSFGKLARRFDEIMASQINVIGNRLVKSIKDTTKKGKDVNGETFKPLSPNTIALGGKKPLVRSGKMIDGLKREQATPNKQYFVIEMSAESRGEKYGAFHNQGYKNSNKPKQWFKNAKVPKREWFGVPLGMRPGGNDLKKAMAEISARIRTSWRKL